MSYRADVRRIQQQFRALQQTMAEAVTWRQWASASSGSGSAYLAGSGAVYTRDVTISALLTVPYAREARTRETLFPGGMVIAGELVASTEQALGSQDQVIWRGASYRIEGDSIPVRIGGALWYRTLLRRGEE